MEFPSPAMMLLYFITAPDFSLPNVAFIVAWQVHYFHRTFIYPFFKPGKEKPFPFVLVVMAFMFNIMNGTVNGYGIFHLRVYEISWFYSWQFLCGTFLFLAGFLINKIADNQFRQLRKVNPGQYQIPRGKLFNYVSNPHYLGEITEWSGWALMTWSPAGLAFALFTFANLFPRAISSHQWYRKNFPDYPAPRKAIIPFVV